MNGAIFKTKVPPTIIKIGEYCLLFSLSGLVERKADWGCAAKRPIFTVVPVVITALVTTTQL